MLRRKKEGNVLQEKGKCAGKRGSALPEGFAPGEGSPRASSHKGIEGNYPGHFPRNRKIRLKVGSAKALADSFCSLGISLRRRLLALQEKFLNCFLLSCLVCRFAHFVLPSCEKKDLLLALRPEARVPDLRLQLLLCLS